MDLVDAHRQLEPPALNDGEVHLWRVDLKSTASAEEHWTPLLSQDETQRAARFRFDSHRRYFVAMRAILRKVLAAYLNSTPAELLFVYSFKEKPSLGGNHAQDGISFNVSHSGDIGLLACTRNDQLGVDVEYMGRDTDVDAIAARFFSTAEQEQLAALPLELRRAAFFRCWTRKEAYIKATGDGLSLPLHQFDVSLAPRSQSALLATRPDASEARRWTLQDVTAPPEYAAAICVRGTGWRLIDLGEYPGARS